MKLFDFLKTSKKKNVQTENIEEIFELASKDISFRPLFYRTILEKELYVLIYKDNNLPTGECTSDENTKLQIRTLADGSVPVFTSIDKIFDNQVINNEVQYAAIKGKAVFDMFSEPPKIILNPYSLPSKEFLPDEIKRLRSGELFKVDEERTMNGGETISIGIPAIYPIDLVTTLKKYCSTRVEIKGAYLGLIHNKKSNEAPHLLIGLDLSQNDSEIFGEIGETIRTYIHKGEPVDMINVSNKCSVAKLLKQKEFRVY